MQNFFVDTRRAVVYSSIITIHDLEVMQMIGVIVNGERKVFVFGIDEQARTITFQVSGDGRRYVRPYRRDVFGYLHFTHNGERYYIDDMEMEG